MTFLELQVMLRLYAEATPVTRTWAAAKLPELAELADSLEMVLTPHPTPEPALRWELKLVQQGLEIATGTVVCRASDLRTYAQEFRAQFPLVPEVSSEVTSRLIE